MNEKNYSLVGIAEFLWEGNPLTKLITHYVAYTLNDQQEWEMRDGLSSSKIFEIVNDKETVKIALIIYTKTGKNLF